MRALQAALRQRQSRSGFILILGATWLAIGLLAASAWLAHAAFRDDEVGDVRVDEVHVAELAAAPLLSTLKDAETGQRGYLLTGDAAYLEPYVAARARLDHDLQQLQAAPPGTPDRAKHIEMIRSLALAKLAELGLTVGLFQSGQADAALAIVRSNRGKETMDAVRIEVDALQFDAVARLARAETRSTYRRDWLLVGLLVVIALALLGAVAWVQRRARQRILANLDWLQRFNRAFGLIPGMMRGLDGRITYWSPGAETVRISA